MYISIYVRNEIYEHLTLCVSKIAKQISRESDVMTSTIVNFEKYSLSLSTHTPSHTHTQTCLEPYEYLLKVPGKNVRGHLVNAFNFWLKIPSSKTIRIKEIVSMLHTASLLIDDIEDGSTMRRGIPCAHKVYVVFERTCRSMA